MNGEPSGAAGDQRLNLATRCPACSTVFRVVQDQLKVSDGWVRCGHCHEVFNAIETLIDLDGDPWPAPAPPPTSAEADRIDPEPIEPRFDPAAADLVLDFGVPPASPRERVPDRSPPPPPRADAGASFETAFDDHDAERIVPRSRASDFRASQLAELDDALDAREPIWSVPDRPAADRFAEPPPPPSPARVPDPAPGIDTIETPVAATSPGSPPAAAEPPAFIRAAPTRRRTSPAWIAAAALLLIALGLQAAFHQRDALAARIPELQPVFEAACAPFGCRLGPLRRVEDIAVENTGLVRTALPGAFQLAVGLRNRGRATVAVPSIELTLTDPNGQLLARRVLAASDFPGAPAVLRAGGDAALQALLATPGPKVSGYTVEIFYP